MTSHLEQQFASTWLELYPDLDLHSEYRFCSPRRFRFDFANLDSKVAIEVQGGIFSQGRHSRGSGLVKEYEKMNLAAGLGWRVFYLSTATIGDIEIYEQIYTAIKSERSN